MNKLSHSLSRFILISVASIALVSTLAAIERAGAAQAVLPEPRWMSTGGPTFQHSTLTRLHNGKVIAVGGRDTLLLERQSNRVEVYDPLTGRWRDAAPMNIPRFEHTAVLLPDGRLLVIGGWKFGEFPPVLSAGPPEIFDPITET